eukprot:384888_1
MTCITCMFCTPVVNNMAWDCIDLTSFTAADIKIMLRNRGATSTACSKRKNELIPLLKQNYGMDTFPWPLMDYTAKTIKVELKLRDLDLNGNKEQLVQRLTDSIAEATTTQLPQTSVHNSRKRRFNDIETTEDHISSLHPPNKRRRTNDNHKSNSDGSENDKKEESDDNEESHDEPQRKLNNIDALKNKIKTLKQEKRMKVENLENKITETKTKWNNLIDEARNKINILISEIESEICGICFREFRDELDTCDECDIPICESCSYTCDGVFDNCYLYDGGYGSDSNNALCCKCARRKLETTHCGKMLHYECLEGHYKECKCESRDYYKQYSSGSNQSDDSY